MATLQGVMDALTAQIRLAVPLAPATGGFPYVCYSGWVTQDALKKDVATGTRSHITVYDLPGERNTTRFARQYNQTPLVNRLTATVNGAVITFGGVPDAGDNLALSIKRAPVITLQASAVDSLPSFALELAAAINAASIPGVTASATGSSVSVGGVAPGALSVVLGGTATLQRLDRQIEKDVLVTVWAPDFNTREAIVALVDGLLGTMDRLPLVNDFPPRILYQRQLRHVPQFDLPVWRTDLYYSVEYVTLTATPGTQIVTTGLTITPQ